MKALGKGSIASIIKVGLHVAGIILWIGLVFVILAAIAYGVVLGVIASGFFEIDLPGDSPWEHLMWQMAIPALIAGALWMGGAILIVRRLRRLFESFSSGEPFKRENADHLRVIWITMLVMELIKIAFATVALSLVAIYGLPPSDDPGVNVTVDSDGFDLTPWFSILVLIVLAEVFREGARLKEEQELTI